MSGPYLAAVLVSALVVSVIALAVCLRYSAGHEALSSVMTVVGHVIVGAFTLATQEAIRARRKRHPTGPHRTVGENDR